MGHYDECRPGYCAKCGAGPGNLRADGSCPFCQPDDWRVQRPGGYDLPKSRAGIFSERIRADIGGEPQPQDVRNLSVEERRRLRPENYARLPPRKQWSIDASLGLLDDEASLVQAKDGHIAQVINRVRDTARVFHDSQQLRARLENILLPELKPVNEGRLPELRALRLWHWRHAMQCRKNAREARERTDGVMLGLEEVFDRAADDHIKFVQTLNIFFAVGDTAEKDDDKNKAAQQQP